MKKPVRVLIIFIILALQGLAYYITIEAHPNITGYGLIGLSFWSLILFPILPISFWRFSNTEIELTERIKKAVLAIIIPVAAVLLYQLYIIYVGKNI